MVGQRIASNSGGDTFDSEIEKFLAKPDQVLRATIDGLQDPEEITEWIRTEAQGDARKGVIAALNQRKHEVEG